MARRRATEWQRLVRRWERSGLSAREFAGREGIAPRTLQWWRWHLREQTESRHAAGRGAALDAPSAADSSPVALVELVTTTARGRDRGGETPVEIVFGEVVVRVRSGFDCVALGHVIDVLEGLESGGC